MLKLTIKKPIIFLFCLIGCICQLSYLLWEFSKFHVKFDIEYDYPLEFAMPEIDITMTLVANMNLSKLYQRRPKEMVDLCERVSRPGLQINSSKDFQRNCEQIFRNSSTLLSLYLPSVFTINDFKHSIRDIRSSIVSITTKELDGNLLEKNICKTVQHFNGFSYFIRISCRNKSQPLIFQVNRNLMRNDILMSIHYNIDQEFSFRFSQLGSDIESRLSKYTDIQKNLLTTARFKRTIVKNLHWPHSTQCMDYDQSLELIKCLNKELRPLESVYTDGAIPFDRQFPNNYNFINYDNNPKVFEKVLKPCLLKTKQPECLQINYETNIKSYKTKLLNLLCVEPPTDPDLVIRAYPKSTISDLIVYVSSILSFWFGISVYGVFLTGKCPSEARNTTRVKQINKFRLKNNHNLEHNNYNKLFMRNHPS